MLGQPAAMPLAIAPMAAHGLAHPDAEAATARAAAAAGVPFILSTMSTCSMEEVARRQRPDGIRWFQLYTQADPARTRELVERAEAAGYGAIVLTVDLPLLGYRERDRRSGFELTGPHGNFATPGSSATHGGGIHADGFAQLEQQLLTGLSWDDLATIRSWSSLPLVLKGIMTAEDAQLGRGARRGCDRGQQPRRPPARPGRRRPSTSWRSIVAAVDGRTEVWVDGGVRRGHDIAIARALGARGVLLGRPILGPRGRRPGRRRAGAGHRAGGVRDRPGTAGHADAGRHRAGPCRWPHGESLRSER